MILMIQGAFPMAATFPAFDNPFTRSAAALAAVPRETGVSTADIVLSIDASASMAPLWRQLARDAAGLTALLDSASARAGMTAADVRLRIVTFRDLYMLQAAFSSSPFFTFPQDEAQAAAFISRVTPQGAGGPCTSGLEALLIAMHSPWRREKGIRHRIAVITDSAAYPLNDPLRDFDLRYSSILRKHLPENGEELPHGLEDLRRLWRDGVGTIDNWNSRILLYTVSASPWLQMVSWPRVTPRQASASSIHHLHLPELLNDIFSTL